MRDGLLVIKFWINYEIEVICEVEGFLVFEIVWSCKGIVMIFIIFNFCVSIFKFIFEEKDEFGILFCFVKNLFGIGKKNIIVK